MVTIVTAFTFFKVPIVLFSFPLPFGVWWKLLPGLWVLNPPAPSPPNSLPCHVFHFHSTSFLKSTRFSKVRLAGSGGLPLLQSEFCFLATLLLKYTTFASLVD